MIIKFLKRLSHILASLRFDVAIVWTKVARYG